MKFQYRCECGHTLQFAASSAGTAVPCLCGRQVKIPKLSELKRLSGEDDQPVLGIADRLRLMNLDKQLPPDTNCIRCQVKTADRLECWVECERAWGREGKSWAMALFSLHWPILSLVARALERGEISEVDGRDVLVRTPLALCENCQHGESRSESNVRRLLLEVDLYRQLLETYPGARVGTR